MARTNVGGVEIDIHGDASHFEREMRGTGRTAERVNRQIRGEFRKTGSAADVVSRKVKGVSTSFIALGAAAGLSITQGINILADFGQAMSTVQAVTGATEAQMAALTAEARRLGASTRFSATQAAEGMIFLARAGYTADEALRSVEGTLKLAQAGGLDLGRAADIASNVLGGFNLSVDETSRVVDVLAAAANSANVTVDSLGEALKFAAPTGAALGLELEEVVAIIGKLGDSGLAGGLGGRGFGSFATAFVSKADEVRAIIGDFDLAEEGLTRLIQRLVEAGITTDQVIKIFRGENLDVFTILANASQDAEKGIGALNKKLVEAGGTADRVAATMDDNLNGAILSTVSALQEVILALGEAGATDAVITAFTGLKNLFKVAAENADILAVAAVALSARAMIPLAISTVPKVIAALSLLGTSLTTVTGLAGTTSAALSIVGGPLTLAIAGAAAAYVYYARSVVTSEEAQAKFNDTALKLRSVNDDIKSDLGALEEANGRLTEAIESQGDAAEATAQREIAAINSRISKNRELQRVYALQIQADVARAKQAAQAERDKLVGRGVFGGDSLGLRGTFDFTGGVVADDELNAAISSFLKRTGDIERAGGTLSRNDARIRDRIISYREYTDTVSDLESQLKRLRVETIAGDEVATALFDGVNLPAGAANKSKGGSGKNGAEETLSINLELLSALERQQAIDLARANENEELLAILEQQEAIIARTADYEEAGLSTLEARKLAQAEITALVEAEGEARKRAQLNEDFDALLTGLSAGGDSFVADQVEEDNHYLRDAFSRAIQDAIRTGDTGQAIRDVFATAAADGLRDAINELTDAVFKLFGSAFNGSGVGSSSGSFLSAVLGSIPVVGSLFSSGSAGTAAAVAMPAKSSSISTVINIAGDASENTVRLIEEKLAANNRMLPDAIDARVQDQLGRGGY